MRPNLVSLFDNNEKRYRSAMSLDGHALYSNAIISSPIESDHEYIYLKKEPLWQCYTDNEHYKKTEYGNIIPSDLSHGWFSYPPLDEHSNSNTRHTCDNGIEMRLYTVEEQYRMNRQNKLNFVITDFKRQFSKQIRRQINIQKRWAQNNVNDFRAKVILHNKRLDKVKKKINLRPMGYIEPTKDPLQRLGIRQAKWLKYLLQVKSVTFDMVPKSEYEIFRSVHKKGLIYESMGKYTLSKVAMDVIDGWREFDGLSLGYCMKKWGEWKFIPWRIFYE